MDQLFVTLGRYKYPVLVTRVFFTSNAGPVKLKDHRNIGYISNPVFVSLTLYFVLVDRATM